MSRWLRRIRALVLLALALMLVTAVVSAGPASAHTDDPVKTTGMRVPASALALTKATYPNRGGWSGGNKWIASPTSYLSPTMSTHGVRLSETYGISEPYNNNGYNQMRVQYKGSRQDPDGVGGQAVERAMAFEAIWYCGRADTNAYTTVYSGFIFHNTIDYWPYDGVLDGCSGSYDRVIAVELWAAQEFTGSAADGGSISLGPNEPSLHNPRVRAAEPFNGRIQVQSWMRSVWYPGLSVDYTPFDAQLPDYSDGNVPPVCISDPTRAECQAVNRWKPYEQAASWDVCSGAPAAEWLSFSWIPDFVKHYAICLFKPAAGFPADPVLWELENSSLGDVKVQVENVVTALPHSESCGTLIDSQLYGTPFRISTCSMSTWSEAKTFIGIGMIVFASLAGLNLVLGTLLDKNLLMEKGGD